MGRACAPAIYFLPVKPCVILLVFLLVSAAMGEKTYFIFRWLWH
jgi:hypothetical protein